MAIEDDIFIWSQSAANAEALSEAIYRMARPLHVRAPFDVTTYYSEWFVHPISGEIRLQMLDEGIYIHPECNINELDGFMQPYIDSEQMPQSDLDQFHADVTAGKGGFISGKDVLPPLFTSTALTYQQMVDGGWFDSEE